VTFAKTETFAWCGVTFRLEVNDRHTAEVLDAHLPEFERVESAAAADLVLSLHEKTQTLPDEFSRTRKEGRRLVTYEHITMTRLGDRSLYEDGASAFLFNRSSGRIDGFVGRKSLESPASFVNLFLTFVLWEAFATRNAFLLHAGAVESPEGRRFLIAANSRQGKSTLTLSLVRSGYAFLADDLVGLAPDGWLYAFPRDLHLDPRLADKFPELAFLKNEPPYLDLNPKRRLARKHLNALYAGGRPPLLSLPGIDVLLFPEIQPITRSRFEPLSASAAFTALIPPSALIFVEDNDARLHLEALKTIVENARCYRLILGQDLDRNPADTARFFATLPGEKSCCYSPTN
jgi:hypothetical protein